jgi:hypothetical protein
MNPTGIDFASHDSEERVASFSGVLRALHVHWSTASKHHQF